MHSLLGLHKQLLLHPSSKSLAVLLFPLVSLQACAEAIQRGERPARSELAPKYLPLLVDGQRSRLRVLFCTRWADVAVADIRVLFIPSLDTYLGALCDAAQGRQVVTSMLSSCRRSDVQLYPPLSWDDLLENKDVVYRYFGSDFMLEALWLQLPSLDSVPAVAASMLQSRADGRYMVKGSFSYGGMSSCPINIVKGQCAELQAGLRRLFTEQHQRCVGIQPFEPSLADFELRVILMPDEQLPCGWRAVQYIETWHDPSSGCMTAQSSSTAGDRERAVANFIDRLLTARPLVFARAVELGMPALRLDCGFSAASKRAFLNELCHAVDCTLFSEVHSSDVAAVVGECIAAQLWSLAHA